MGRPSRINEQREELLPVVANAFGELGYRGITTRELAERCDVKEMILYRLWPGGKKDMFLATIEFVWKRHEADWMSAPKRDARSLLELESSIQGSRGLFRIVFQALAEADDADVQRVLAEMYRKYAAFMTSVIEASTKKRGKEAELAAWSLLGLGTMSRIGMLLGLKELDHKALMQTSGRALLK